MIIYDVGMHNGDDTHYYLTKGAKVVGIEANPELVLRLRQRFAFEIEAERLYIIESGVGYEEGIFPFYVAPNNAPQSSFSEKPGYSRIDVRVVKLSSLFAKFGMPDFAKVDVEHMDLHVLQDLMENDKVPQYISVEAHTFSIVLFLYRMNFTKFRLVNCRIVRRAYKNHPIVTPEGRLPYSFPDHSSGPLGEDLPIPWQTIEQVCSQWIARRSLYGAGWYDVHATGIERPTTKGGGDR